jgi:hypothetical protein
MLRRRRLPAELAPVVRSFEDTLRLVEGAKEAVVDAVPRGRNPGRSLADALLEFDERVREAGASLDAWWHPSVAERWNDCRRGIDQALARAERLRLDAPEFSFDQLTFTVQDLIAPLEPFEAAMEAFRTLHA